MSRFPITTAINRLACERMVVIEPQHGSFVARIAAEDVRELLLIRRALEAEIAAAAAADLSPETLDALDRNLRYQAGRGGAGGGLCRLLRARRGVPPHHRARSRACRTRPTCSTALRSHLERIRRLLLTPPGRLPRTLDRPPRDRRRHRGARPRPCPRGHACASRAYKPRCSKTSPRSVPLCFPPEPCARAPWTRHVDTPHASACMPMTTWSSRSTRSTPGLSQPAGITSLSARAQGPQDGHGRRSRRASRSSSSARSSASPRATSRRASGCMSTMSRCRSSPATTVSARTPARADPAASSSQATFEGFRRAERQGRHAQLSGDPDQRELLGLGGALHGQGDRAVGRARRPSRHRRRDRAGARHGLRHRLQGRGLRCAQAHPMGLCDEPEYRRRAAGRAGLRSLPDRPHEAGIRDRRERHVPHDDDPGDGRHAQDRRGRRQRLLRHAARPPTRRAARRCRPPS